MASIAGSRAFLLLWTASVISTTGTQIVLLVLPIEVYRRTGSEFAIAVIWAAYLLPGAMFGAIAGLLADRWDKKRILIVANLAQAAAVLLLLPVGYSHWLLLVFGSAFLEALMGQIFVLAEQGLVPQLVRQHQLMQANSLSAVGTQAARMIGPVLGGLLLATWGYESAILIDSLSFAASAVLIARLATRATPAPTPQRLSRRLDRSVVEDLTAGILMSVRNRRVWSVLLVGGLGLLAGTSFQTVLVPFVIDDMGESSAFLGSALGLRGLAAIVGGFILIRAGAALAPRILLPMSLGALGLGITILAIWPGPFVFVTFMLIAGPLIVASGSSQRTLLQTAADPAQQGRVLGLSASSGGVLALLGTLYAGIAAETLGPGFVMAGSGILLVVVAVIGLRLIPRGGGLFHRVRA